MPTNIFIIEDHPIYREVLCEFLNGRPDFHICGSAGTAQEALLQLSAVNAALVLIDMTLPDMNGIELVSELQCHQPDLRCLMLSGSDRLGHVQQAFDAGAWGYIVKGGSRDLEEGIQHVVAGELYVSRQLRPVWSSC